MSVCFYVVKEFAVVEQQSFWAKICILSKPMSTEQIEKLLASLQEKTSIAIIDYDKTAGDRHIVASIWNAIRRANLADMRAKTLPVEFILFVSGETQIAKALKKVGVSQETRKLAIIDFESKASLETFLKELKIAGLSLVETRNVPPCNDGGKTEDLSIERTTLTNAK